MTARVSPDSDRINLRFDSVVRDQASPIASRIVWQSSRPSPRATESSGSLIGVRCQSLSGSLRKRPLDVVSLTAVEFCRNADQRVLQDWPFASVGKSVAPRKATAKQFAESYLLGQPAL